MGDVLNEPQNLVNKVAHLCHALDYCNVLFGQLPSPQIRIRSNNVL